MTVRLTHPADQAGAKKTLKKLENREGIIILPADRGQTTVVMDKGDYIKKAEDHLKDEDISTNKHKSNRKAGQPVL